METAGIWNLTSYYVTLHSGLCTQKLIETGIKFEMSQQTSTLNQTVVVQ